MPTKDFFVRMITKDISLEDCLLDLIDNCLDGARRTILTKHQYDTNIESYHGYHTELQICAEEFSIKDNCGGISIDNAIDYAFHFGRRDDAPNEEGLSIGLYGIGMKRAILKMGKNIEIQSSTKKEAFRCDIDVESWLGHEDWEFDMDDAKLNDNTGTTIRIRELYNGIADEFADPSFVNGLSRIIARDYSRFLQKGFKVLVNGEPVSEYKYAAKSGAGFQPYRNAYVDDDDDVRVEIFAGMAAPPPDNNDPAERVDTEYHGWFVACNDRFVLAADKTQRTVWGNEKFARWHFQYNGFMGMVFFYSNEPDRLPWTTTKRDVDESSPIYRRAVQRMKAVTLPWIEYTNRRKTNLDEAKNTESTASSVPLLEIEPNQTFTLPDVSPMPHVKMANINYQKTRAEVEKAAEALGNANMSFKGVGEKTFEYFMDNEVAIEE